MKIAVIGVGAMGSVYAALLADAGHEVWAVDRWTEQVEAIQARGLRVEGASGDRTVTGLHAAADTAAAGECDLYIIATKADGVGAAARAIAPFLSPSSLVLTIQNGLGAADRIAEHMPTDNVLLGVAEGFGASMRGPGHAHHNAMKEIRLGEIGGGITERLTKLEALWRAAGFSARAYEDIDQLIWEKFVCNVTFSAPCTVFNRSIGDLMADSAPWRIALGCAREAYDVGAALGVTFRFDDLETYVSDFGRKMPAARPSMLLDHDAGRRSEIDAINGMVPVVAVRLGMAAPYNETLTAILRSREASFG
ncbi:MAG: 2-dehydropantoate 2-reductase [Rhodobacteraceae bacterium]|nr:2-dehydropantoate 2-reductase [Paracoccaceae bacterium]